MPLDSDDPQADAKLSVKFYEHKREPHVGEIFVQIMNPGDPLNIYDQPATEHHKRRFADRWNRYQQSQSGDISAMGVPLATWAEECPQDISEGQLTELGILRFQTVEQVASASDAQVQRVGMGGAGLRERARVYLSNRNRTETDAALEAANARADRLEAQMAALMERVGGGEMVSKPLFDGTEVLDVSQMKRGPGRPRKVTEDVGLDHAGADQSGPG